MQVKGSIFILLSAVCFALLSIIAKTAYAHGFTPLMLLFLEKLLAAALLWPVLFRVRPRDLKLTRGQLGQIAVFTLLGSVTASLGFFWALQYLDASVATILLFTNPVVVLILAGTYYREPLTPLQLLSLVACITGGFLVVGLYQAGPVMVSPPGVALALLASIGVGFMTFYSQRVLGGGLHSLTIMAYSNTLAALVFGLMAPPLYLFSGVMTGQMWALALGLALISSVIPSLLLLEGIGRIGAGRASLLATFELPCSMFFAFLLLGERLAGSQLLGAALVLGGILLVQLDPAPRPWAKPSPETGKTLKIRTGSP